MLRSIWLLAVLSCVAPALSIAQQNDSILVDDFITAREYVDAGVLRVNPGERTITVRGDVQGETRTFNVPEGSRISVNGQDARLRDIRRDDQVRLTIRPRNEEIVIERIRVPNTNIALEARRATPAVQLTPTPESTPIVAEVLPLVLPKTASLLPSILMTGFFALLFALMLRGYSSSRSSYKRDA